uniref:Arachidonate 5-lipoxygenase b, tandem duplicate 3 n=1 Tax=Callorhinchus milii TaxID=7868 RepID=A0A4W3K353_CALMI
MASYTVTVSTGSQWFAGTDDYIYLTLVGTDGCSERTLLDKPLYDDFERGAVDTYDLTVSELIGELQVVKLEKRKYWVHDDWYCRYITIKTPSGEYVEFPCYRWVTDQKEIELRDGKARLPQDDTSQITKLHRRRELEERQKAYRWKEWHPGFPLSIDALAHHDLPRDIQFDSEKGIDFVLNYTKAIENLYINRFMHMFQSSWNDFGDFEKIFVRISNTISEYVMQHWKEDFMFGYQFLNGCNPVIFTKCKQLPDNFPVTSEMVATSLERQLSLEEEIEKGNIYLADYQILDEVPANSTDPCTIQYLAAPLCLLYNNSSNKLLPIAIQLKQNPDPETPIFLPSDDTYDWLLAKIWVRSADFHIHQTVTHLLRTHLTSEVFGVALYRQLAAVHPLFKLLVPHVRFTIAINTKAREQLICKCGLFDKANATGGGGHVRLIQKAMDDLTYASLCFPEAIRLRGVESSEDLPYYYFRDDGLKVWDAVQGPALSPCVPGFPKAIKTIEKLIKYLTMIIFTTSAQHAGVNFGQYDWCSWIPNSPPTMRQPPPTSKGKVTVEYIIESLPDRGRSCWHLGAVWALSQFQDNELFLGSYPDEHFTEKEAKEAMVTFRQNLQKITNAITERNINKKLPYYYMSPDRIPNSVAV